MNPLERLLAWLWDPRGGRRNEQYRRLTSTNLKLLRLQQQQRNAADQVRRTQQIVRDRLTAPPR